MSRRVDDLERHGVFVVDRQHKSYQGNGTESFSSFDVEVECILIHSFPLLLLSTEQKRVAKLPMLCGDFVNLLDEKEYRYNELFPSSK